MVFELKVGIKKYYTLEPMAITGGGYIFTLDRFKHWLALGTVNTRDFKDILFSDLKRLVYLAVRQDYNLLSFIIFVLYQ